MHGRFKIRTRQAGNCPMKWNELEEERCSIARTVSVIGDRWTLLVLRDCFLGVRRFDEFLGRLGISRPMLSDRLARLVEAGVLKKVAYQRSEEHTSELQSPCNLVCRLLLEKKKNIHICHGLNSTEQILPGFASSTPHRRSIPPSPPQHQYVPYTL